MRLIASFSVAAISSLTNPVVCFTSTACVEHCGRKRNLIIHELSTYDYVFTSHSLDNCVRRNTNTLAAIT